MRYIATLAAALLLGGCAGDAPPDTAPITTQRCVPKRTWTPDEMIALANALTPIPDTSILFVLEADWQRMRDDPHTCRD